MLKGIHTSASGMVPRARKQELLANNLANVGTPGFKREVLFTEELSKARMRLAPKQADWETPMVDRTYVDFAPGTFDRTGNPLDLALDGDGYFRLQDDQENIFLTRSGHFTVDEEGYVTFPGGLRLMGEGGPIQVGRGDVMIGADGAVQVNNLTVARITPVTVADQSELIKRGGSLFGVPAGTEIIPPVNVEIQQGYLEAANVDVVHEMVEMIIAFRTYEANAKAIQQQDQTLDHLFQRVGGDK
jgi:flagellar basal-body rod protein FlgG